MTGNYRRQIDRNISGMFKKALSLSLFRPLFSLKILSILARQGKAAERRKAWEAKGVMVPPFLAMSVTHRCNLNCAGCYSRELHQVKGKELSCGEWKGVLGQARDMGVSIVTVLGGEPYTRADLFDITSAYPELLFLTFSNGQLLDLDKIRRIRSQKNLLPVLSIEGFEKDTDERRGKGVYAGVGNAVTLLRREGVFFGASITATSANFNAVTDPTFIRDLYRQGCRLFFYIEYLPAEPGTEGLCLTSEHHKRLADFLAGQRRHTPALFVDFPGDEYALGGCLSAAACRRGAVSCTSARKATSSPVPSRPSPIRPFARTRWNRRCARRCSSTSATRRTSRRKRRARARFSKTGPGCKAWRNRNGREARVSYKEKAAPAGGLCCLTQPISACPPPV